MAAKHIQGADLRNTKTRIPIQDVFPLDTPFSMYIEPTNACNIRCTFCPTSDTKLLRSVGRKTGTMDRRTFQMVLDDLAKFPRKVKLINFYKDGEPLLHKNYPEMAAELKPLCEQLWVKTNGTRLTPAINERLASAGFNMIGISVIASHADGYKRIAGVDLRYDLFVQNIRDLYHKLSGTGTKVYIKMADVNFLDWEIDKFYTDFESACDFIAVENLHGWSRTDLKDFTLGAKPATFDGVPNVKRIACAWPLYQMTVNWNGTVQPCNEDWSWNNIVGNININSLPEIWDGKLFNYFRRLQLQGKRFDNAACGNCWQTMSCLDDVDAFRDELLERMA